MMNLPKTADEWLVRGASRDGVLSPVALTVAGSRRRFSSLAGNEAMSAEATLQPLPQWETFQKNIYFRSSF